MFTWDEPKRQAKLKKRHRIDFRRSEKVFRGFMHTVEDARESSWGTSIPYLGLARRPSDLRYAR
jgi:uncharacterized DUF497 family protein